MFSARTSWPRNTNPLTQAENAARAFGADLYDLTVSNPTNVALEYDKEVILSALSHESALRYEPLPFGPLKAREAVADYYSRRGITVQAEDVLIVASTSEAYSFLFKLLANAGESALVPRPSYPLFNFLADLGDVVLEPYHLRYDEDQGWLFDPNSVIDACNEATRAVITVNPNNPTGSYLNAEAKAALGKIAAENELAIISDEVFLDYLTVERTEPAATMIGTNDALTFSLSGLSKVAGLPQMKVGWIVLSGPKNEKDEARSRLEIIADAHLSVSAPVARALPELLLNAEAFIPRLRKRIEMNRRALAESGLPVRRADGGWYAMIDLPQSREDEEWALELMEKDHVLVHPGYLFDVEYSSSAIISVIAEPARFKEGVARIAARITQDK
jgi:aspartate/methionine/tyrosine aminotransferase